MGADTLNVSCVFGKYKSICAMKPSGRVAASLYASRYHSGVGNEAMCADNEQCEIVAIGESDRNFSNS